ncbi:MAG: DUF58 domain-containing protein [Gammaproteobacteria bacterium]|nr:DUF58 domain-containing protein [Gammaproteobacteria bacterium]MCP5424338.1 DUF58 domain-containing protein [Gammaproteobacteria bacterium]MCP5459092.1 DUF58 domain-containing protein [Gammaproteobacteria bacterium]
MFPAVLSMRRRIDQWTRRRHPPQRQTARLERQRIYILPTGFGYVFGLMLGIMFLWAINYNNSLSFALTFLLAAVALVAMRRTHDNLLHLCISPGKADAVFVGQEARFTFHLEHSDSQKRYGIALQSRQGDPCFTDVPVGSGGSLILTIQATQRGWLQAGRLRVLTRFPLDLFQAWSWVEFEQACLVYPRPQGSLPLPLAASRMQGAGGGETGVGSEDFAGLRPYRPGDAPRHVAWKAAARRGELLVKRFTDQARSELWLDWDLLASADIETRLSQLCLWVLKAEGEQLNYGLHLPGVVVPPARGEGHRRQCLETLALYGLPKDG